MGRAPHAPDDVGDAGEGYKDQQVGAHIVQHNIFYQPGPCSGTAAWSK